MSHICIKDTLLSAILADPWTKEHYIKLIEHLRNNREEVELEQYRELYASRFLPDCEFWRLWFIDIVDQRAEEQVQCNWHYYLIVIMQVDLTQN